jgi:hypothetical protein
MHLRLGPVVMTKKPSEDAYGQEEAARRRDALAKHMLNTPPQPLKAKAAAESKKPKRKPAAPASARKRGPSA